MLTRALEGVAFVSVIDADGMKQKIFSVTIEPALGELRGLACVCVWEVFFWAVIVCSFTPCQVLPVCAKVMWFSEKRHLFG